MAPQRLTSELVDTAVADYRHITEWAADHYQRGMLTDDEGCREVSSAFYDAFWVLLKRNHAFSDYPLWQEYLAEQREQWRRDREHSIRLLRTPIKIE